MKKLFVMMFLLASFITTEVVLIAQEKQIEDTLKKAKKTIKIQEKKATTKAKMKQREEAIKDQVINDLNMLCQSAWQHKIRSSELGGNNSFLGFDTASAFAKLSTNHKIRGKYAIDGKPSAGVIQFKVLSPKIATGIWMKIDSTGTTTIERP